MLKVAIIGSRGIPNFYGGFEQFAEYVAVGLAERGHDITVYNSHTHPYQEKFWKGVKIVHCTDWEDRVGTAGQFLYDLNCILHARKQDYDVILQLGYTSSSVWGWLLPKQSVITTNMDGLEWKRTKYSKKVQRFLKFAEKLGVKYSNYLIADSIGIQKYLQKKYTKQSVYIPYGSHVFEDPDESTLGKYAVLPYGYDMLIARLEPENSIEIILDGVAAAGLRPFIVVGKHKTKYGEYLKQKYKAFDHIRFAGGIYDINILNNLRCFSNLYFHGHTVGGTNPSLLEAMGSSALICAHNNVFNESILNEDAFYFTDAAQVKELVETIDKKSFSTMVSNNVCKIKELYNWDTIIDQYEQHFLKIAKCAERQMVHNEIEI